MQWLWGAAWTLKAGIEAFSMLFVGDSQALFQVGLAPSPVIFCPCTAVAVQSPHNALKSKWGVVTLTAFAP